MKKLKLIASYVCLITYLTNLFLTTLFYNHLYFLIPAIIAQMFISTEELVIPTGTQTNEANAEIETQPVIAEDIISK